MAAARMSLLEAIIVTLAVAAACVMPGSARPAASPELELVVETAPGGELTFVPDVLAAPADTLVRVVLRNDSTEAHNLTFQAPITAATRTIVEAGSSDVATFVTPGPGSYPFVCTVHIGMAGTLRVD